MKLNRTFAGPAEMPATIPLFPMAGALLLPRRPIQLTVFEPRYLEMLDDALGGERLIGVIQPSSEEEATEPAPELYPLGCAGRIVQYAEIGDGRCFLTLMGVARFHLTEETPSDAPIGRDCRLFAVRRGFSRRRGRSGGRSRGSDCGLETLRRGQRDQSGVERHPEGVERGAGQRPVDDEPVRSEGEAGAARGQGSEVARRNAGGDHDHRAGARPGRSDTNSLTRLGRVRWRERSPSDFREPDQREQGSNNRAHIGCDGRLRR